MWFTQHDRVVYSTTSLRANWMLVGLIVRKPAQQFQFVHVPTEEENVSSQLPRWCYYLIQIILFEG